MLEAPPGLRVEKTSHSERGFRPDELLRLVGRRPHNLGVMVSVHVSRKIHIVMW